MREILFRGKRFDNGEWIYGDFVDGDMICECIEDTENVTGTYYGLTPYVGFVKVISETVGQYTGLNDKNGKKIFEGDIVRDSWEQINSVEYCIGFFYPFIAFPEYRCWSPDDCEVIGNIHDNPKLLKGASK